MSMIMNMYRCILPLSLTRMNLYYFTPSVLTDRLIQQRSPHHFEFFGLDIVADRHGECWLIEANR